MIFACRSRFHILRQAQHPSLARFSRGTVVRMSESPVANHSRTAAKSRWTRRRLLKTAAGIAGLGTATFAYAWQVEPHWIEVVQRRMPVRNLPESLTGNTLVQISDLHIGPIVDDAYMASALELVSRLKPDILAITGDFMTYRSPVDLQKLISHLKDFDGGRLATVAVPGNHDYGTGWADSGLCDRTADRHADLGILVLRNESIDIKGLHVFGIDDFWGPHFDHVKTLQSYRRNDASVVLCHNPDAVDCDGWNGFHGWILSGHTHGGQCRMPYCKPPVLPVRNQRYVAGEVSLSNGRKLYINRGLGYLRKIRFNVRPEITVFTLDRELENS